MCARSERKRTAGCRTYAIRSASRNGLSTSLRRYARRTSSSPTPTRKPMRSRRRAKSEDAGGSTAPLTPIDAHFQAEVALERLLEVEDVGEVVGRVGVGLAHEAGLDEVV